MLRRILISLGYFVLTAAVVLITVGLVAYGQGIEYDVATGKIIHTGLVIIQSNPSGAQVGLDGRPTQKKTAYRASFQQGSHTFELTRAGFYPWKKLLPIVPSQVTLADYVLLVPKKPAITTLDARAQIAAQSISKDHQHLAYITGGPDAAVYALSLGGGKPAKVYLPKPATAAQPAETLSDVTWSDDASHLLVTTQVAGQFVVYLMNADGSSQINLTQQYGFAFVGLKFSTSTWQQLYWISPDGLRRLDVGAQSVSGVLAAQVSQFQVTPDRLLYIQTATTGTHTLWSLDSRGTKQELIQALPDSPSYALAFTVYNDQEQLVVIPATTGIGTLYSGIYGSNPVAKTIAHSVTAAAFSPDGHLLAFSSPTHITTYDLQRAALAGQFVTYEASGLTNLNTLAWFDNYHLLTNQNSRLIFSDYDGTNALDLGALSGVLPIYSSSDVRSIIAFQPASSGTAISLDQITIKP